MGMKWDPYFLVKNAGFENFWKNFLAGKNLDLLFIMGLGFDPRMTSCLEKIMEIGGSGKRDVILLDIENLSDKYESYAKNNIEVIKKIIKGKGKINTQKLKVYKKSRNKLTRIGPRKASEVINDINDLIGYQNVILDISSMPRGIYFPLAAKILNLLEQGKHPMNFFLNVSEDAELDKHIQKIGIDESAMFLPLFGGEFDLEDEVAGIERPKLWIPILGENQAEELDRIYTLVKPDEICPILPYPSNEPRRGDNLIMEYRSILFDRWQVEPANIIYADETNPFDLYRQLYKTIEHYNKALKPLGGCKVAVSALSSKLLSVGALLATYELYRIKGNSVGFVHIEGQDYEVNEEFLKKGKEYDLHTIWLNGEVYE